MPKPALSSPFTATSLVDVRQILARALAGLTYKLATVPLDASRMGMNGYALNPILISRAFINGDHWQNGAGWIGPWPNQGSPALDETMLEIARMFVSKNVILEMVNRHTNGVVGTEPRWGLTPLQALADDEEIPPDQQALIDDAEAMLTAWWDDRHVHELLQRAVVTLLYAERSMTRLYVPRGMLVDVTVDDGPQSGEHISTVIQAENTKDALDQIWIDHPLPELSAMSQDEDTKQWIGVCLFNVGTNVQGQGNQGQRAEVCYLDGDRTHPLTIMRSVDQAKAVSVGLDFGGQLPMFEMCRDLFVTPQMWQAQRALNLATSMIPRNNITAGFLERTILNAQLPGKWEVDEFGKKTHFVADPLNVGAGTTNSLVGVNFTDPDTGKVTIANPSVHVREPVASDPLVNAARSHYIDMLEEGSQEHILSYQKATASGKTFEQARADFTMSLRNTQSRVEAMGRWLVQTVLMMAEEYGGEPGKYSKTLRAYFNCRLDTGPVTADERTANDNSVKAGTLSLESAIVRNGETDPDAEMARLASQPGANLTILERQSAMLLELTQSGAALEGAAEFVGIDPKMAKKLVGDGTPPPAILPPQPPRIPGKRKPKALNA